MKKHPLQGLYDWVMTTARKVIYGTDAADHQRFDVLVKKLKSAGGDIGDVIGQTAAVVISNIQGAAQKKGQPVPVQVLFQAGREIVAEIILIAQKAGVIPPGKQTAIEQQAIAAGLKAYQKGQAAPQQPAPQAATAQPPAAPQAPVQPPPQPAGAPT